MSCGTSGFHLPPFQEKHPQMSRGMTEQSFSSWRGLSLEAPQLGPPWNTYTLYGSAGDAGQGPVGSEHVRLTPGLTLSDSGARMGPVDGVVHCSADK